MRMALDMAQSLAFLHTMTPPLIHADFKVQIIIIIFSFVRLVSY